MRNAEPAGIHADTTVAEMLNPRELVAIENLLTLAALQMETTHDAIRSMTAAQFGATDITGVPSKDYDDVIRYLVELVDDLRG